MVCPKMHAGTYCSSHPRVPQKWDIMARNIPYCSVLYVSGSNPS